MFSLSVFMHSTLLLIVVLFGVSAVVFTLLKRVARQTQPHWYTSELVFGGLMCPALVTCLVFGFAFLLQLTFELSKGAALSTDESLTAAALIAIFAGLSALLARKMPPPLTPSVVLGFPTQASPLATSNVPDRDLPRAASALARPPIGGRSRRATRRLRLLRREALFAQPEDR